MIPEDDRGLLLGDGLFETVLWDGGPADFDAHADRLASGCGLLGLPAPERPALLKAAMAAVERSGLPRAAVRLNWTAGSGGRGLDRPSTVQPRLFAGAFPAPERGGASRLATAATRRNETSALSRVKSLSYLDNVLARREAAAAGADEALMLNTRGEIACAGAANLFWFEGDRLVTPALACGVLAGTMRARVLARAAEVGIEAEEVAAPREALDRARGLFLTNSLIGVRVVETLDGRAIAPHPAVSVLAEA